MVSSGSKCDRQGKKNPCACNLIPDTTNYGYQQKNNWADFYEFYHPILQYPTSGQANTAIPFPHLSQQHLYVPNFPAISPHKEQSPRHKYDCQAAEPDETGGSKTGDKIRVSSCWQRSTKGTQHQRAHAKKARKAKGNILENNNQRCCHCTPQFLTHGAVNNKQVLHPDGSHIGKPQRQTLKINIRTSNSIWHFLR